MRGQSIVLVEDAAQREIWHALMAAEHPRGALQAHRRFATVFAAGGREFDGVGVKCQGPNLISR